MLVLLLTICVMTWSPLHSEQITKSYLFLLGDFGNLDFFHIPRPLVQIYVLFTTHEY